MKALFIKYKLVIKFLVLFLGSYILLTILYSFYLSYFETGIYHPDFITNLVAKQSNSLINSFGYVASVKPQLSKTAIDLYINQQFLAEIVEGCNAISVIILFVAFVLAFSQEFKKTVLYIVSGSVLIYGVNLIRISILAIALYKYPAHQEFLHQLVFPAIIYGMVFLLWVIWVNMLPQKLKISE
ncbi:MAG: exosortase family protein XrtF [Flavobacteriales bacterium]